MRKIIILLCTFLFLFIVSGNTGIETKADIQTMLTNELGMDTEMLINASSLQQTTLNVTTNLEATTVELMDKAEGINTKNFINTTTGKNQKTNAALNELSKVKDNTSADLNGL